MTVPRKVCDFTQDGPICLPASHRAEALAADDAIWDLGAVPLFECRFPVEQVDVRWRAVLQEIDHTLRLWCVMEPARQTRRRGDVVESQRSESAGGGLESVTAGAVAISLR